MACGQGGVCLWVCEGGSEGWEGEVGWGLVAVAAVCADWIGFFHGLECCYFLKEGDFDEQNPQRLVAFPSVVSCG